jgi:hypothetical protein
LGTRREEDARADIYSLACVLYECLTGSPPFDEDTMAQLVAAHLNTPPPQPSTTQSDVPAQIDQVIATGMAKDPDERYSTAVELADAARDAITVSIPRRAPAPTLLPTTQQALTPVQAQPMTVKAASPAPAKSAPPPPTPTRTAGISRRTSIALIAGAIAVVAVIAAAVGIPALVKHRPSESPPTSSARFGAPPRATAALEADFAQLKTKLNAAAGIAVGPVGNGTAPITMGDWQTGPAWSTITVPLIIAALREQNPPQVTPAMVAASTESDDAAAESIWEGLGEPVTAEHRVEAVLSQTGDPTTVQSRKVRPEFTAFGQTIWPLTDQVRFTSAAWCDNANAAVFELMGRITQDQSWGIGTIAGTRFKGGWGPSPTGSYLVRQIGVLAAPKGNGMIAVALAAQPASGKFDGGTADLTEMAKWLIAHLGALPARQCDH